MVISQKRSGKTNQSGQKNGKSAPQLFIAPSAAEPYRNYAAFACFDGVRQAATAADKLLGFHLRGGGELVLQTTQLQEIERGRYHKPRKSL